MKNENQSQNTKNGIRNSFRLITVGAVVGVLLSIILVLAYNGITTKKTFIKTSSEDSAQQEITIEYLNKKLENISELSTAEMTYNGLFTITEGKIPFITKKGFSMIYTATVKAGIDASLIRTEVLDNKIRVMLPASEILMSWVDPDSIQFYDEKHALFNWSEKTDVTEAISAAEKDVKNNADTDTLLKRASQQAEYVVKGILQGSVGDREIIIIH